MDEQQNEAAKQYDQRMFAWVNHRQLPLQSTSPGLLDLITDLFGNKSHDANKKLWDPNRPAKRFRLLVKGSARMGEEQITTEDENEFDFGSSRVCSRNVRIVAASFRDNIIPRGTILNGKEEADWSIEPCETIDLDKHSLKLLCQLLRWKYFGYGLKSRGV